MQRGFSLVELSIVLVILGLLTGGILAGQSLIRAAELRSVVSEFQRYSAATQAFRDKYLSLPGDMTNATRFWGSMTNCSAASPSGTGTQTCNGDGNGLISGAGAGSQTGENYSFWKHLANSGLLEGSYTGVSGPGSGSDSLIGINVPASKLTNAGWTMVGMATGNISVNFTISRDYGNTFFFGAKTSGWETGDPVLKPEEAWNIDTKLDDGKPAYGSIIARYWANLCTAPNTGVASTTNLDASYRLSDTTAQCALFFLRNW